MIISSGILKDKLRDELAKAQSIWIATAMITKSGWSFIQKNLPEKATQHYLIGIDLATDPNVFESIITNTDINARVYQTAYTFHPKVYLIKKLNNTYTAFVGSSNTTNWGLEKNVEMNFQINDQRECKNLLNWFNRLYGEGYLITQSFIDDYKSKYTKASVKAKEIRHEAQKVQLSLSNQKEQFFSKNHHEIFNEKYHRVNSEDLQVLRKEVRHKFLQLHNDIYPEFSSHGLLDIYCHHQSREIVSRHFFNPFSGNYINAMWMHYGKSYSQLQAYPTKKEQSFINNIRMQVIIHKDSIGIWLVLGKDYGSVKDREYFRYNMKDVKVQKEFFDAFKNLGDEYWINVPNTPKSIDIRTQIELVKQIQKEKLEDYFIIGCDIDSLDDRISTKNISKTIIQEFVKLYPLYEIMKHKY
tara:strand:- start:1291 stop:2529 length:1239 start_codon:yes stop_codon:yes gene_type:complete